MAWGLEGGGEGDGKGVEVNVLSYSLFYCVAWILSSIEITLLGRESWLLSFVGCVLSVTVCLPFSGSILYKSIAGLIDPTG